ncbi:MAG TPA: hypothetical protein VF471_16780 [Pseudoxanthomonas sp.]
MRMRFLEFTFLLIALCTSLAACASHQPVQESKADFNGRWSVKWCDRTDPKLDCGGFDITLVQNGERICGDFGGALVNLRQVDEGTIVGTSAGNTAILAVESMRNQSIALVRATLQGNSLHWVSVDEIKRGSNDVDVIATNSVLIRDPEPHMSSEHRLEAGQTCDSYLR